MLRLHGLDSGLAIADADSYSIRARLNLQYFSVVLNQATDFADEAVNDLVHTKIKNNFSDDFDKAVATCVYDPTCKLGWQANQRFWENDKNQIYGRG